MKKMLMLFLSLHIFISLPAFSEAKGYLFIIGGGSRPETMMKKFVKLADKFNSGKIIIFPMASSVPDEVGSEQAEQLKRFGAREVEYHILTREQALKVENTGILDDVGGVFFSGGVQSRLMDILIDTPIHRKLLEIYEKGAVIGGTSAGAAVMSEIMITGDEKREVKKGHEFETIQANNIVTVKGFGFIKTAIIDQHFIRRKRHNRLISLVAENPKLLGIGIDESTAIIFTPDEIFEVVGERNVVVYDATQAQIRISPSRLISGFNMIMHILSSGDRFNLKTKEVMR
ncbi:MAG: cyanophycinase [Candidatus Aminicenantes bacterium]|jgi:cyanophycinase|nr:MAG: cyanophycinase [Candidatus Aminicenantes bacterium]